MKKLLLPLLITSIITATGCSDGSSSTTSTPEPLPNTVIGTASQGGAIHGTIEIAETSSKPKENIVFKSINKTLGNEQVFSDGSFVISNPDQLKLPAILKINGANSGKQVEQYGLILASNRKVGHANISSLTRLLISKITGVDAAIAYSDIANYQNKLTQEALKEAQDELKSVLQPLFAAAGTDDNIDLTSATYEANYTALDALLAIIDIDYKQDKAIITYKPAKEYTVKLPYNSAWTGLLLSNNSNNLSSEKISSEIKIITQSDRILEKLALLNKPTDKESISNMLHPNAHWFGDDRGELLSNYHSGFDKETSELDRYRDFSLVDVNAEKSAYLLSYTERFENGVFASGGRRQTWFAFDSADQKLKFLGDINPLPTSANAYYRSEWMEPGYAWEWLWPLTESFNWFLQVDAFVSTLDCATIPSKDKWQWKNYGDLSFVTSLPKTADHLDFKKLTVSGPGLPAPVELDRVFHQTNGTCHLVSSHTNFNPVLDGLYINTDQVKENAQIELVFIMNDDTTTSKTIYLGKAPEDKQSMINEIHAKSNILTYRDGKLNYKWNRKSSLVTEGDLWMNMGDDNPSIRRSITDNENQAEIALPQKPFSLSHNAWDYYGRAITDVYSLHSL